MGSAASIDSQKIIEEELAKPADASDIAPGEAGDV